MEGAKSLGGVRDDGRGIPRFGDCARNDGCFLWGLGGKTLRVRSFVALEGALFRMARVCERGVGRGGGTQDPPSQNEDGAPGLMEWVEEKYGSKDPQLHGWGC